METYIGTKIVQAEKMTEFEFFERKGQEIPKGRPNRAGYLVVYPDGYESWSPKEVFEGAYRLVTDQEKALLTVEDVGLVEPASAVVPSDPVAQTRAGAPIRLAPGMTDGTPNEVERP